MSSPAACADGYDTPAQQREDSTTFMVAKVWSTDIRSRKRSRRQAAACECHGLLTPRPGPGVVTFPAPARGPSGMCCMLPLPPPRRLLLSCAGADCVRPERPRALVHGRRRLCDAASSLRPSVACPITPHPAGSWLESESRGPPARKRPRSSPGRLFPNSRGIKFVYMAGK